MENNQKKVKKIAEKLLKLLGVSAEIKTNIVEGNEPVIEVIISSEKEAGLLIGAHGGTLLAIQSFFSLAIKQHTGEWVRIAVDVDGWKNKQEDYLKDLATQAADRAISTGQDQNLYNLNSNQRRIVHTVLSEIKEVSTESIGEGEARYLVVKPK